MSAALAIGYNGLSPLWQELLVARGVIFWLMLGGFVWVIGDLFQQYAAKVPRNSAVHSSFEFESALGTAVGNLRLWRTAQP